MKNQKYYFYDLHTHTIASGDAIGSVKDYVKVAKKRGLTGFAITDHNKVYKGEEEIDGITIIPGSEISLKDGSHLLAYYIKTALPKGKLTLKEAIKEIKKQGGYCSLAHPTNIIGGYFKSGGYFKFKRRKIKEIIKALKLIDCIETGNASEPSHLRLLTKKIIKEAISKDQELKNKKLIYTGSSDSHSPNSLGLGVVKTREPLTKENFLKVIGGGEIIVETKLKFVRWVLYNIEQILVMIIKITFLYNNKIIAKIFFNTFAHIYLRTKHFLLKRKKEVFNLQKKYNIKNVTLKNSPRD